MFAALNSFLTRAVSGYFLNKSLRFRSSASASLSRTFGTPTNNKIWTWSGWVKRGKLGVVQDFFAGGLSTSTYSYVGFQNTDVIRIWSLVSSSIQIDCSTTAVFRDPAAWYHVVLVVDTTQATNSSGVKLWVNGVQQTLTFSTYVQNSNTYLNSAALHAIAALNYTAAIIDYFDGEMAEINFVDGQALAPTAFGASSIYNQWLPIKYAGTYGTNGFYLPFTNTTSTSTLVADSSGNGNNWTPNNISLTAGSTYDSLTDVPTLTSTTVANYAVLNPLDAATTTGVSSNGNLTWTNAAVTHQGVRGSIAIPATGAFYIEGTNVTANGAAVVMGFGLAASTVSLSTNMAGTSANSFNFYSGGSSDTFMYAGTTLLKTFVGGAFAAGDVIQLAVDTTNTKMWLGKNNVWYNSVGNTTGDPATGANPTFTTSMVGLFFMVEAVANSINVNFGQQPFVYTAPTGFLPLNTFNI
jgi:hypothetical protein